MKKLRFTAIAVVIVAAIGFILPSLYQAFRPIDPELNVYNQAYEPFGFLLRAARIVPNNGQYDDRCAEAYEQVLLQTHSWMMVPGPIVEACASLNDNDEIQGIKSIGVI